jgi:hypothetical protein
MLYWSGHLAKIVFFEVKCKLTRFLLRICVFIAAAYPGTCINNPHRSDVLALIHLDYSVAPVVG